MSKRTAAEERVLRAARKYARMKTFGVLVEDGHTMKCCQSDVIDLSEFLLKELGREAVDMISAMTYDSLPEGEIE